MDKQGIGQVKNLKFNSEKPKLNIDMDLNNLVVLCGKNGTGKSFVLVMQYIANSYLMAHLARQSGENISIDNLELLQHLMDYSLDIKDLTGTFSFEYEHCTLTFTTEEGEVRDIKVTQDGDVELVGTPVIYLSSNGRLFQPFKTYMILKETYQNSDMTADESFEALAQLYKHYDLTFYELVLHHLDRPYTLSEDLQQILKEHYDLPDTIVSLEKVSNDIIITRESGEKHSVSKLGSGHQAIVTMMIFTKIIHRVQDGR